MPKFGRKRSKPQYDDSEDTKAAFQLARLRKIATGFLIVGGVWVAIGLTQEHEHINNVSTPVGTSVSFVKTGDQVTLNKIAVSKDKRTIAIRYKYSDQTRKDLSMFGNNYQPVTMFKQASDMPKGYSAYYGIVSIQGDGVMVLHADKPFKNTAFMLGLYTLKNLATTETQSVTTDNSASSSSTDSSSKDERQIIMGELSNADVTDSNTSASNDSKPAIIKNLKHNAVFIRVNPYSKGIKQFSSTGSTNYNEIFKQLFVKDSLARQEINLKQAQSSLQKQKSTTDEMKKRVAIQPDDAQIQSDYQTAVVALQTAEQTVSNLKTAIEKNKTAKFDKSYMEPISEKGSVLFDSRMKSFADALVR